MKIKKVIATVVALAVVVGGTAGGIYGYKAYQDKNLVAEVQPVSDLSWGYWGDSESSYGMVTNDSSQEIYLADTKTIKQIYVEEGDFVEVGDPLMEYDTAELRIEIERKKLDINTTENELAIANHKYEQLKKEKPVDKTPPKIDTSKYEELLKQDETNNSRTERDAKDERIFNYLTAGSVPYNVTQDAEGNVVYPKGTQEDPYKYYCNPRAYADGSFFNSIRAMGDEPGKFVEFYVCQKDAAGQMVIVEKTVPVTPPENGGQGGASGNQGGGDGGQGTSGGQGSGGDQGGASGDQGSGENPSSFSGNRGTSVTERASVSADLLRSRSEEPLMDAAVSVSQRNGIRTASADGRTPAGGKDPAGRAGDAQTSGNQGGTGDTQQPSTQDPDGTGSTGTETTETEEPGTETPEPTPPPATVTVKEPLLDTSVSPNTVRLNGNNLPGEYESERMWYIFTGEEYIPESSLADKYMDDFMDNATDWEEPKGYTEEELAKELMETENQLKTLDIQRRQQLLQLESMQKTAEDGMVYAEVSGEVKSVGDPDEFQEPGTAFLVVTGDEGLYVSGTISELLLDDVEVGTVVTANSWESGMTFDATITEISDYPSSGGNSWGDGNPNVSYYNYTAYIEDSSALRNGEYVDLSIATNQSETGGLYIDKAYVRQEDGKSYCMIADENDQLKKQYVVTGKTIYGSAVEIKSGLTEEDRIAFPYGKNAVEGATVTEATNMYY